MAWWWFPWRGHHIYFVWEIRKLKQNYQIPFFSGAIYYVSYNFNTMSLHNGLWLISSLQNGRKAQCLSHFKMKTPPPRNLRVGRESILCSIIVFLMGLRWPLYGDTSPSSPLMGPWIPLLCQWHHQRPCSGWRVTRAPSFIIWYVTGINPVAPRTVKTLCFTVKCRLIVFLCYFLQKFNFCCKLMPLYTLLKECWCCCMASEKVECWYI